MSITTITSKGQITIPKDIREALGLAQGDKVIFSLETDHVVLTPLLKGKLDDLYACLPTDRPYPGHDKIRQKVQFELGQRLERGDE